MNVPNIGEPLAYYLHRRLTNLFKRRYTSHWQQLNIFLCGVAISKKHKIGKHPVHLDTFILKPDTHRELYWGVTYRFQYPLNPKINTNGFVRIADHLIQIFSSSWDNNKSATMGGSFWAYELADPNCIEKVIDKFKQMFPTPTTTRR